MTVQLLKTQSQIRPTIAFVWNWKGIVPQFTFSLYFWMLCIFFSFFSSLHRNTKNQTDMHFYMTMTRKSFCYCFMINPKEFSIFISLLVSHIFSKSEMTMKVSLSTYFDFFSKKKNYQYQIHAKMFSFWFPTGFFLKIFPVLFVTIKLLFLTLNLWNYYV